MSKACWAMAVVVLLAGGAVAEEVPRILLVNGGDLSTCDPLGPCEGLTANFPAGVPFTFAVGIAGVTEISEVKFGISMPAGNTFQRYDCEPGDLVTYNSGDVMGFIWTPDEPCRVLTDPILRIMNLRTTVMWPTAFAVVENPSYLEITVTDCSGTPRTVLETNRGVAGAATPGYVPCGGVSPVEARTWAGVKAVYGGE